MLQSTATDKRRRCFRAVRYSCPWSRAVLFSPFALMRGFSSWKAWHVFMSNSYRMTEHNHCRDCSSPMRSTGWCYRARPHCEASFTVVYVHRQLARASSNQMRCFRARILTFLLHYLYLLHCFGVSVALLVEMDDSPCSVLVTR